MKIECVFEDSEGMLWIGTHDRGVVRFDGDRFEGFTRHDGLSSDNVFSILEDQEGNLWFGTSGGLVRYTPQRTPPKVTITEVVADRSYGTTEAIEMPTTAGRIGFRFRGRWVVVH